MLSSPRHRLQLPVCHARNCHSRPRRAAPSGCACAVAGRGRGARAASLQCAGGRGVRGGGAAILGAGRRAAVAAAVVAGEAPRIALCSPPSCAASVPPLGGFLRSGFLCGRARAVAELLPVATLGAGWGLQAQGRGGCCRARCPAGCPWEGRESAPGAGREGEKRGRPGGLFLSFL